MSKRVTRAEVPTEATWRLEDLFATPAAWEVELAAVERAIPSVTEYKGRLGEGAGVLLACLDAQEALLQRLFLVLTYAGHRLTEDGTNPDNQGADDRAGALAARYFAATAFIKTEMLALPEGTLERYLAAEPRLAELRTYLEKQMQEKPHMLAPETEFALASLGEVHDAPYRIYERAKSSDMQFPAITTDEGKEIPVSFAVYEDQLEESASTEIRRKAFHAFSQGLKSFQNTLAATFATEVKKNVVTARLRKYPSATHMLLQPHQVSLEAYHNLLDIIQAELAPHMRRLVNLRRRVLGLDKVLYCDIEAPLDPAYDPQVSYEEGCNLIYESLAVMGPEYMKIMRTALKERWVDRADNVGKATGAFCSSPYGSHSYILMTWTGSMRNVFTLAHELGHAGHFELANRNQRMLNTEPSMFFVEAPSTMNELLLGQHILVKSSDTRMRRWVLMQFLKTYHHNFVRHLLEGELQRRIYERAEKGEAVTATTLSEEQGAILSGFWGDAVSIDDGARLTWMRQPHYYMGLYPYTYSAGLTTSTAAAQLIREEGKPAVERWLSALRAGGTKRPLELAAMAGVDMSKPDSIRTAVAYVGTLVDELERSFE